MATRKTKATKEPKINEASVETKSPEESVVLEAPAEAKSGDETRSGDVEQPKKGLNLRKGLNLGGNNNGLPDGRHFKGWWPDLATLSAAITATPGDAAYVKDASPATTWSIYEYDSTSESEGYWGDSGTDVDTTYVQTFMTGESLNEVPIDDTHLDNPASGALAKAEDAMLFKQQLRGVTLNETKVSLTENTNFFDGKYVKNNNTIQPGSTPQDGTPNGVLIVNVEGVKRVRFLGVEKTTATTAGYGFSSNTIDPASTAAQLDSSFAFNGNADVEKAVEYIVDVPEGMKYFACTINKYGTSQTAVMTLDLFYCYLESGETVKELIEKKQDKEIPIIEYTDVSSSSSQNGYITASGITSSVGWVTKFFPVQQGDTYKIKGRYGTGTGSYLYAYYNGSTFVAAYEQANSSTVNHKKESEITVPTTVTITHIAIEWSNSYESVDTYCKLKTQTGVYSIESLHEDVELLDDRVEALEEKEEYNILCLGNSLTECTMGYLPWIIKEVDAKINFNLYLTYDGGSSLADYKNWLNGSSPSNVTLLQKYDNQAGAWVNVSSNITVDGVLGAKKWDFITVQQTVDRNYDDWDTYFKPYIQIIHNLLYNKLGYDFKLGYLMTPTKVGGGTAWYAYFQDMLDNSEKMLTDTATEFILPAGTALQNARKTYLDSFGAGGHLTADGSHVSAGIGCLICAYANALVLLKLMGSERSILGDTVYPDDAWRIAHNVTLPDTTVSGLSKYNMWVAQQCAVMAVKYPMQVIDMVAKGMVGQYPIAITASNCTSSNYIESANSGDAWSTTLVADAGYEISSVVVMMGETDITSTSYDSTTGVVSIANVTASVTISVTTSVV